jgi:protein TonB
VAAVALYPYIVGHSQFRTAAAERVRFEPLGFAARSANGKLLLTWNAGSATVRNARRAVLSITDGGRTEDVDLSLTAFHTAALVYEPVGEDVTLRLRVSSDGAADTVESVRGIVTAAVADPAATQPMTLADAALAPTPAKRLFAPPTATPVASSVPDVAEPPAMEAELRPAPGTLDLAPGRLPASPPPPAPAELAPVTPAAVAPQRPAGPVRVGSLKVVHQTAIAYPSYARQVRVGGSVTLQVRIGADGRVREAAAVKNSGPDMLRAIAVAGVKTWVFEPPLVDGKRVDAITFVDVAFKP